MLRDTARAARTGLVALLLAGGLGPLAAMASPGRTVVAPAATAAFSADLRACQTARGGRLAQRRRTDASHPRIAACLRQRGWSPDGTPSLDRLLAPG